MFYFDLIDKYLINYIRTDEKKQKCFLFLIGCYPHRKELKHNNPPIEKELCNKEIKVIKIFIDISYKSKYKEVTLLENTLIYPCNIDEEEYDSIVYFSHFAKNFNCLTYIAEFTSILRKHKLNKFNITNYLYITPSDCLKSTEGTLFNPILEKKSNITFYYPKNNILREEINFLSSRSEVEFDKINFCIELIKYKFGDIKEVNIKLLSFMEIDNKNIEVFNRNDNSFYPSLNKLKTRMNGYNDIKTDFIINEFLNNDEENLYFFAKKEISNIILDIVFLKNNFIENNLDIEYYSNFNSIKDLYNKVETLEKYYSYKDP